MDWFIILVYIITVYGIANILAFAHGPFDIFDKMHNWLTKHCLVIEQLITCMMCGTFWLGLLFSVLNMVFLPSFAITPFNILIGDRLPWWVIICLDGAFTSGAIWLIHTIQSAIEKYADD